MTVVHAERRELEGRRVVAQREPVRGELLLEHEAQRPCTASGTAAHDLAKQQGAPDAVVKAWPVVQVPRSRCAVKTSTRHHPVWLRGYFPGDYAGLRAAGNGFVAAFTVTNQNGTVPQSPIEDSFLFEARAAAAASWPSWPTPPARAACSSRSGFPPSPVGFAPRATRPQAEFAWEDPA